MTIGVPSPWHDRRIILGISGGIAAYKLCTVASTLAQEGAQVRAVLTEQATQFITPLTLATLCRHRAYGDADFWSPEQDRPLHISLGEWAEAIVLAPLTAHTLGKLVAGLADNLLTNLILASTCPVLAVPAMNTDMWEQPVVQHNWQQLLNNQRFQGLTPGEGRLACDRVGTGRLAEPSLILSQLQSLLLRGNLQDFQGQRLLITAGGTREYLDPVRFLGNPATGKMGVALAAAAAHRGAQVTLIHGTLPDATLLPSQVVALPVTTAQEMQDRLHQEFPHHDRLLMAAAVGDMKPGILSPTKLPKAAIPNPMPLEPIPDLLASLQSLKRSSQRIIGFAAQTGDIITPALEKLQRKGLDGIVANPIDQPLSGFGSEFNQAVLIDRQGTQTTIAPCSKLALAHHILDWLQRDLK